MAPSAREESAVYLHRRQPIQGLHHGFIGRFSGPPEWICPLTIPVAMELVATAAPQPKCFEPHPG